MPSGEHPFDGDMVLIKNKNKNKSIYPHTSTQMLVLLNAVLVSVLVLRLLPSLVSVEIVNR